jgi:hypothetical protein
LIHGETPESPPPFRIGVRYLHEQWDLRACRAMRHEAGAGFSGWLRTVVGCQARALGAWDDPGPLLAAFGAMARNALRKALPGIRKERVRF